MIKPLQQRESRYMQGRAQADALVEDSDAVASIANTGGTDPWVDVSADVICRFMDVLLTRHAFSHRTRTAYSADLQNLDHWMRRTRQRTAITATAEDLHEFFSEQASESTSRSQVRRFRSSARRFYRFLRDCHYRDDDPMATASSDRARSADARSNLEAAA